jgi:hypothetical protein
MTALKKIGILSFGQAFFATVLLAAGCAVAGLVCAADIPPEYMDAVRQAEAQGLALYEAEQKGSPVDDKTVAETKGQISTLCDFSYKAVRVAENGQEVMYLLGQPQHDNEMAVGRHFRIIGADVQPSSRSCFTLSLGTPQRRPAAGPRYTSIVSHANAVPCLFVAQVQDWNRCWDKRRQLGRRTWRDHVPARAGTGAWKMRLQMVLMTEAYPTSAVQ